MEKLGLAFRGNEWLLHADFGEGGVWRLLRQQFAEPVGINAELLAPWRAPGLDPPAPRSTVSRSCSRPCRPWGNC